jgi:hypothetical protein
MRLLNAAALVLLAAGISQAGTLNFTLVVPAGTVAGSLDGTLQPDNNTFVVSSFGPYTVAGAAGPALNFLISADKVLFGSPKLPTVTIDGSYLDIEACQASCNSGTTIALAKGDTVAFAFGGAIMSTSGAFGSVFGPYNSSWHASLPVAGTPEPGTLSLGLAAAAFVTALSRRKRLARTE